MDSTFDADAVRECSELSLQGRITFPEVVRRLGEAGVERYTVDLSLWEKITYGRSWPPLREPLSIDAPPPAAELFSQGDVQAAIAASQKEEIDYPEFLRRILAAGTVGYSVFLDGRKAIYFSREGDFHVEPFPPAPGD